MKMDLENQLLEIDPEEFPIMEFKSVQDFEQWMEARAGRLATGTYYLTTQMLAVFQKKSRIDRRTGRKKRGRPARQPKRSRIAVQNVVAKFSVEDGRIVKTHEWKAPRKYAPYLRTRYELIQQINENKTLRGER